MAINELFWGDAIKGYLNYGYGFNPEYYNLSDEEKYWMDYQDKCLTDPDNNFSEACFHIMMLILEASSKISTEEEMTVEDIQERKEEILNNFNKKDKERLNTFMYACIQNMGIYSEDRVKERKLRKKGND